jgi:hypothetical protein
MLRDAQRNTSCWQSDSTRAKQPEAPYNGNDVATMQRCKLKENIVNPSLLLDRTTLTDAVALDANIPYRQHSIALATAAPPSLRLVNVKVSTRLRLPAG